MNQNNNKQIVDHRDLGEKLKLFYFSEYAPGIPFFLPKGVFLYQKLQELIRGYYEKYNYQEVMSPMFMSSELWKCSGHYDYFKDNMFFLEEEKYALKPMNCPAHMDIFKFMRVQKKDLPLRIADFGKLFRNENSGSLHGLARVKSFSQDDAHIFVSEDLLEKELNQLLEMVLEIYNYFGFKNIKINLSGRPQKSAGSDSQWDQAESILKKVLSNVEYIENPGEGAFYGPKIDFEVADSKGRYFQLGSIQLDFQLPHRFNLKYQDGVDSKEPIVIHRAILGSLERFIAILLEHYEGWIPAEFSKVQAKVIVLQKGLNISHYELEFKKAGIRYEIEFVDNIKQGVKSFYKDKVPYLIILGQKEVESRSLVIKNKDHQEQVLLSNIIEYWRLKK